jgi:hypothetical protein
MSPELRRIAVQGMITFTYNRFQQMVREYEKICQSVEEIRRDSAENKTPLFKAASAILDDLETQDHMGKLKIITTTLAELREQIKNADVAEIDDLMSRLQEVQKITEEHFLNFVPKLRARFTRELQRASELN